MTRMTLWDVATVVVTGAIAALAVWVALHGPSGPVPMHFGVDGRPDRWGDRSELAGLFAFMAVMALATAGPMGWFAASADDPARRRGLRLGQAVSLLAMAGTTAFVAWTILSATAVDGETTADLGWAMAGTSALMLVIGATLGRVAPNPVVGVRTPWAFKSRRAWDRSNRLAGRLFFWLGLIGLVSAAAWPQPLGLTMLVVAVLVAAVAASVESWRVWRADPDRQPF